MFRFLYLCSSPSPIKRSTVKGMGRVREKVQCVVEKHEGKRTLGRPGSRWEIILKQTLRIWDVYLNWIDLAHDKYKQRAAVHIAMGLFVPQNVGFFIS